MTWQTLWQAPVSPPGARSDRRPAQERLSGVLRHCLNRCPVLTMFCCMLLTGAGMLAAVSCFALAAVLPLGLLFGWF